MILPSRIMARDRRRAAIHEAGHVAIGRHIGLHVVFARLEKVSSPARMKNFGWGTLDTLYRIESQLAVRWPCLLSPG
jgi:hypothetical protein